MFEISLVNQVLMGVVFIMLLSLIEYVVFRK